jgi:hypothetical protein
VIDTRREDLPTVSGPARTRDPGLTEFLLDVLNSVESYEDHIRQAERDDDRELAAFLHELRRQDLVRSTEAVRLLRRPVETSGIPKETEAC